MNTTLQPESDQSYAKGHAIRSRIQFSRTRILTAALMLVAPVSAVALTASPAAATATCSMQAQTPYRHIRITGQKMVYGHAVLTCGTGVYSGSTHARLAKFVNGSWVWYGYTATDTSFSNLQEDALANEFLCNNYGWGSSGSGYYRTYAWATYTDYTGTHSTGYYASASTHLSC